MATTTDLYIRNFNTENSSFSLTNWLHDNPEDLRIAQIAATIFGALAVATLPLTLPACLPLGIGLAAVGGISLLASLASWIFLNYITCARHDLREHVFEEVACEGGRLYYQGNVPILELTGSSRQNGEVHGYLLGAHIETLYANMEFAIHTILRQPKAGSLPNTLAEIRNKVPRGYLEEMEGLAAGFNRWAEEARSPRRITADDVLLIHLIPDSKHFHPREIEQELASHLPQTESHAPNLGLACTTILQRTQEGELIFGRNMDWCPFGQGGEKSLVIVWKPSNVAALTIPGLIGVVTGWNDNKLCLAMNVCPGETRVIDGTPAILFNRMMLELHKDLVEVDVELGRDRSRPLGPYHMTVADAQGRGSRYSFYQRVGEKALVQQAGNKPVFVLNCSYPNLTGAGGYFNSETRCELLTRYFDQASDQIQDEQVDTRKLVENALQLTPYVNSYITMHSLVFAPQRDEVTLAWDNGYAASMPKERLSMSGIFNG